MSVTHFSGPVSSYGLAPGFELGSYYTSPSAVVTFGVTADGTMRLNPVLIHRDTWVDRIAFEHTGNGSAGTSVIRCGIYDTGIDYRPYRLVVDGGTVATNTGAGGNKEVVVNTRLKAGLYWVALAAQTSTGTAPSVRVLSVCDAINLVVSAINANISGGYAVNGITGPFPPFLTGPAISTNVNRGWLRIAA